MPSIRQLFKSMQFQLIFWSVSSLLLLAIIAGGYGFWYSYEDFNDFQDDNLKSMSALLEQTIDIKDSDSSPLQRKKKIHFETDEDEGSITVDVLNKAWTPAKTNKTSPKNKVKRDKDADNEQIKDIDKSINVDNISSDDISLKNLPLIPSGISTQIIDNKEWRVYRSDHEQRVIIVRQRTEFQEDLAEANAMQAFLPLILGIAFLMLLLPFIMWRMLKPVRQLHSEINSRQESDLSPLSINNLPTELLPLAQSLNRLLALVKISIERQQRFIADAAHELRSPLTAVSLQLQRLQRLTSDTVMTEGLDKLAIRLTRNQRLVEQLLTLARAGNITNNIEHTPVSIKAIIEQVIGLLIPIIDSKNIELNVEFQADDYVSIDETSALMLVKNLIQNAIVYTPDNGQVAVNLFHLKQNLNHSTKLALTPQSNFGTHVIHSGKIDKFSKLSNDRLVLQIMDSGKGIHPDNYTSSFEPFVRLNQPSKIAEKLSGSLVDPLRSDSAGTKTNEIQGTGLGLSIVKTICEQADIDMFMSASTLTHVGQDNNKGLCITLVF